MKDNRAYLEYVRRSIEKLEDIIGNDVKHALEGEIEGLAIERLLETIADATKYFPDDLKNAHPEVDWQSIVGFRNRMVHGYFGVSPSFLAEIVRSDIPVLKKIVEEYLHPMAKDYYKILEADKKATQDELKKAYRKLAMKWHPDQNKGNAEAEAKFKELNEAYDTLKDEQKRGIYDQLGPEAYAANSSGMGGGRAGGGGMGGFSDIFEDMFGDIMGRGGRGGAKPTGPQRGNDTQYTMEISLEDAYKGKEETIQLPVAETCDKCSGSGAKPGTAEMTCPTCSGAGKTRMQQGFFTIERACPTCHGAGKIIEEPCDKCGGAGRVRKTKSLRVKIPPGVETGRRIRLPAEGEAGVRGGPSGDLYVLIAVRPHPFFQRDDANLYCRVPVPMTSAALGGEVEVPTMDGKRTKVKIPPGTQTGQQFRLKGKGMPVLRSEQTGDLFIEVAVETPVNLTGKQRDLLKSLHESIDGKNSSKHSPEASGFMRKVREVWDDLTE